jgi:hypothetical protein
VPTFDAKLAALEPVEYDFTGFGQEGVKGVIPEPTEAMLRDFLRNVSRAEASSPAEVSEVMRTGSGMLEMIERMIDTPEEDYAKARKTVNNELSRLCRGKPTAAQIGKLPDHAQRMFLKYLLEQFALPELRAVGLNGSTTPDGESGTSSAAISGSASQNGKP